MYELNVWLSSIGATVIVSLCSLVGVVFISFVRVGNDVNKNFFKNTIAFAIGVLLTTIFIHLIPEAFHLFEEEQHSSDLYRWIVFLCGIFCSILVEIFAHQHSHHIENENKNDELPDIESQSKETNIEPVAYNVIFGDAFHNFTDGLLIATAFTTCTQRLGWIVTLSIVLHELPHELLDFTILIHSGMSVKKAVIANLISSLTSVLGAIVILSVGEINGAVKGYLMMFSAGILTFISLSQLLPSISKDDHHTPFYLLLLLLGSGLIGLLSLYHPECE